MKFYQLRPGARFRYKDDTYRKISPLKGASDTDDSQRLIARSADVILLGEDGEAVAETLPPMLPGDRLESALKRFLITCQDAAARVDPPLSESQRTQLQRATTAAGRELLTSLALDD